MNSLLQQVLDAHGGLERWRSFHTVQAKIVSGGGLWPLKGLVQDAAPRQMTASLHEQFASVRPFGKPEWKTSFRADRIAIETLEGEVVQERMRPRASFEGHTAATPWDALHRAYFNGYAMWTYLTTPFLLALPGFEVREIEPVESGGETWRGLRAKFPEAIASHSVQQDFYFGPDFLIRRHDYDVDVAPGLTGAQLVDGIVDVQGLRMPTRRRAFFRGPDRQPVRELLLVSIDLADYAFR